MKRNPFIPRIAYVAKTYPRWVTYMVAYAWAEATAHHGLKRALDRSFVRKELSGPELVDTLIRPTAESWSSAESNTRFDRYLPWAAKTLNGSYKIWRKAAKAIGGPPEPNVQSQPRQRTAPDSIYERMLSPRGKVTPAEDALYGEYLRANDQLDAEAETLDQRFGTIVRYAERSGVDLNTFDTIADAAEEADAFFANVEEAVQGDVVYQFPDGWTVQELKHAQELESEGEAMGHCVGDYCPVGYQGTVLDLDERPVRIFSLRDPKGGSHATMEWDIEERFAAQLRGKGNAMPRPEYLRRMVCFRLDYLQPFLRSRVLERMRQTLSPTAAQWEDLLCGQSYTMRREVADQLGIEPHRMTRFGLGSRVGETFTLEEETPGHVVVYRDEDLERAVQEAGAPVEDLHGYSPRTLFRYSTQLNALAFPIWLDTKEMMTIGSESEQYPSDTDDEMVLALAYYDWETGTGYIGRNACELTSRAANPGGRPPRSRPGLDLARLKRKLMQ